MMSAKSGCQRMGSQWVSTFPNISSSFLRGNIPWFAEFPSLLQFLWDGFPECQFESDGQSLWQPHPHVSGTRYCRVQNKRYFRMVMLVLNESFNVFLRYTTFVNVFMICCEAMCSVQCDITVKVQVTHGIHHQCLWTASSNEYLNTFSLKSRRASRVDSGTVWVWKETNVPSISKNIAFTIFVY